LAQSILIFVFILSFVIGFICLYYKYRMADNLKTRHYDTYNKFCLEDGIDETEEERAAFSIFLKEKEYLFLEDKELCENCRLYKIWGKAFAIGVFCSFFLMIFVVILAWVN
jgi:hypothetical protein